MMYLPMEDRSVYTIKDIYKKNKQDDKKMLSTYQADFWKDYRENSDYFDRRFMIMFKSFFPIEQETEEGLESVCDDFRYDVYSHLMANDKRYSELYRVQAIPDDTAYSLTNNVDYTEEYSEEHLNDLEFNKGQQIDDEDISRTFAEREDTQDLSKTFGLHEIDTENSRSSYNESGYSPTDKSEVDDKEHTDTEDNTLTYGAHTDTEDNSYTSGTRKDTTDDDGTKEYTLHKVGNIGVQTVDDMLKKHWENWNLFDFYTLIFKEIARDLLRGV